VLIALSALSFSTSGAATKKLRALDEGTASGIALLWRDPTDIAARDLFYGQGGKNHVPHGVFTFVKEDRGGTSPKFVVRDQDGVKWKVKIGIEARPETAASRLAWAVGYYTDEDYFVRDLPVLEMPAGLHRGQNAVDPDGSVHNVRLEREPVTERRIGHWRWRQGPFAGTREMNGLRVLMALINNWDLKDENNAIYQEGAERVYVVSDLGASFGSAGRSWPGDKAKGNFDSYSHSKFIRKITSDFVDFQAPARPMFVLLVNPKEYFSRIRLEWIGRHVPRDDARWVGGLLSHLSPRQIRDAFRAAGYSPQDVERFSGVVEDRIAALTDL